MTARPSPLRAMLVTPSMIVSPMIATPSPRKCRRFKCPSDLPRAFMTLRKRHARGSKPRDRMLSSHAEPHRGEDAPFPQSQFRTFVASAFAQVANPHYDHGEQEDQRRQPFDGIECTLHFSPAVDTIILRTSSSSIALCRCCSASGLLWQPSGRIVSYNRLFSS